MTSFTGIVTFGPHYLRRSLNVYMSSTVKKNMILHSFEYSTFAESEAVFCVSVKKKMMIGNIALVNEHSVGLNNSRFSKNPLINEGLEFSDVWESADTPRDSRGSKLHSMSVKSQISAEF